jgi:hypothetical protein
MSNLNLEYKKKYIKYKTKYLQLKEYNGGFNQLKKLANMTNLTNLTNLTQLAKKKMQNMKMPKLLTGRSSNDNNLQNKTILLIIKNDDNNNNQLLLDIDNILHDGNAYKISFKNNNSEDYNYKFKKYEYFDYLLKQNLNTYPETTIIPGFIKFKYKLPIQNDHWVIFDNTIHYNWFKNENIKTNKHKDQTNNQEDQSNNQPKNYKIINNSPMVLSNSNIFNKKTMMNMNEEDIKLITNDAVEKILTRFDVLNNSISENTKYNIKCTFVEKPILYVIYYYKLDKNDENDENNDNYNIGRFIYIMKYYIDDNKQNANS